jgi:hypothetical protein
MISMGYEDKKAILPPLPPYPSEQFCHFHLLWFKIMTVTAQTTQLVTANKKYLKHNMANTGP